MFLSCFIFLLGERGRERKYLLLQFLWEKWWQRLFTMIWSPSYILLGNESYLSLSCSPVWLARHTVVLTPYLLFRFNDLPTVAKPGKEGFLLNSSSKEREHAHTHIHTQKAKLPSLPNLKCLPERHSPGGEQIPILVVPSLCTDDTWIPLQLIVAAGMGPILALKYVRYTYRPSKINILQQAERLGGPILSLGSIEPQPRPILEKEVSPLSITQPKNRNPVYEPLLSDSPNTRRSFGSGAPFDFFQTQFRLSSSYSRNKDN